MTATQELTSQDAIDPNQAAAILAAWPREQLLARNLAALRLRDPDLADRIAETQIPDNAQLTLAHDATVTYRLSEADGRRAWLGCTCAPSITTEIHVDGLKPSPAGLAMQGIGSGAEAAGLLAQMSPYRALFVVEDSYLPLALAFTLHDYAVWLSRGQLVLLVGDDPAEVLVRFFDRHRGYNPVTQSVAWTWRTPRENRTFAASIAAAMQSHNRQAQVRLGQAVRQINLSGAPAPADAAALVAANYSRAYTPTDYCTSRDALAGLAELGAKTDWMVLNRPDRIAHEAQVQRLAELKPNLLLLVDAFRNDFGVLLPQACPCVSLLRDLDPAELAPDRLGPKDLVCPSDPLQAQALTKAGLKSEQVVTVPPGANPALFRPLDPRPTAREQIVFLGESHPSDPEAYDLKLPTHKQLWNQVAQEIRRDPAGYTAQRAATYLTRAQACGVELRSEELRNLLSNQISQRYGETILRETYLETLAGAGLGLRVWSPAVRPDAGVTDEPGGWAQGALAPQAAGTIGCGAELNDLYNSGEIFVHIRGDGRADRYLLDGIAAGAFFLVRAHRDHEGLGGLGRMFRLGKELVTFTDARDLLRKVRHYLCHPQERQTIAAAARQRVLSEHTWGHRMSSVLRAMTIQTNPKH